MSTYDVAPERYTSIATTRVNSNIKNMYTTNKNGQFVGGGGGGLNGGAVKERYSQPAQYYTTMFQKDNNTLDGQ